MKIYVYSLWSNRFIRIESEVDTSKRTSDGLLYAKSTVNSQRVIVASEPKVIHNGMVWLETKDDRLAASLLTEYQKQQITKLESRIDNHNYKIELLSKITEEEYNND